ncbi:hypothetical protein RIF29_20146 [Crotalaria pallida]|uniref:MULE transposase domain-containing protein n=1 Tax=Crotalaria pallida TaxID=3830 RepID=A0AAN9I632_CROPI
MEQTSNEGRTRQSTRANVAVLVALNQGGFGFALVIKEAFARGASRKGYYGGQLLAACSQDGNNQFFVIAYAAVEVENKDSWTWFLNLLINDVGDPLEHGYDFITNKQKVCA